MSPLNSCLTSSGTRHTNQRYVAWQSHRVLIRPTLRALRVTLFMMCLVCRHDK